MTDHKSPRSARTQAWMDHRNKWSGCSDMGHFYAGWDAAVAAAATAIEQQDRTGYEWVPGSLWDAIYQRFAPAILKLRPADKGASPK